MVASARLQALYALADRAAPRRLPVLVLGETGSGKELLARRIHARSPRAQRPFCDVNCAALPDTLLTSELFGHAPGAFTGAQRDRAGWFERADGGTLLLDEVGELSLAAQAALLRVLETGVVQPLGGARQRSVDVRVVATTHRDLEAMVAAGTFREDLWYRLNTITLTLPPLRERPDDVRALVERFLAEAAAEVGRTLTLTKRAWACLLAYGWPGNVRALRNEFARAAALAEASTLDASDFSERLTRPLVAVAQDYRSRLRQCEAKLLREVLERTGWNQSEAARLLDMPRRTLVHKLGVLGLQDACATGRRAVRA